MKIVCENCTAKYSIADEKVKGKVFKIRCKKCGESIVVRGDAPASEPEAAPAEEPQRDPQPAASQEPAGMPDQGGMDEEDNEAQTKVFDYSGYRDDGGEPEWHIVVDGEQQGPYFTAQIIEYLEAGSLEPEGFIWKEGFGDWLPIKDVPEFSSAGGAAEPSPFAESEAAAPVAAAAAAAPAATAEDPAAGGGGLFDEAAAAPTGGGLFDQPESGGMFGDSGGEAAAAVDTGGGLFSSDAQEPADGGGIFSSADAETEAPAAGGIFSSEPAAAHDGGGGLFSAPGTEEEAGAGVGGDIFGDLGNKDLDDGLFSSAQEPAESPRVSAEQAMMTGQRSENSVLFSLSNLQALAADSGDTGAPAAATPDAGPVAPGGSEEASGLIDIRSLASSLSEEKDSDVDDLLAIGGAGGFGATLGAPVLAAAPPPGMSTGKKIAIIGGGVALIAIVVVVLIIFMGTKEEEAKAQQAAQIAALEERIQQMAAGGASAEDINAAKEELEAKKDGSDEGKEEMEDTAGDTASAEEASTTSGKSRSRRRSRSKSSSGSGSSTSEESTGSSSSSGSSTSKPKTGSSSELDDLLGGAAPKPKSKPKPSSTSGSSGDSVKASLDRSDVQKGMAGVAGKVKACGGGESGTVSVKVVIGGTGRVISAVATGSFAGTPVGNCAARAVRQAKFPKSQKNLSVRYPFKL